MIDHDKPPPAVPSPCVRNCCLDEQDICLGCHRTLAEILGWNGASHKEKLQILIRCRLRQQQARAKPGKW